MIEFTYLPDRRWLAVGAVIVLAILFWSYRRAGQTGWAYRGFLMILRCLALALVLLCLLDPQRLQKTEHPQTAHLAVLLDDSRSMSLQDVPGNRLDYCRQWLTENLSSLPTNLLVSYHTLDPSLTALTNLDGAAPRGDSSPIGDALEKLINSPQADAICGIILCSDGIVNFGQNPESAARSCRRRGLPIFTFTSGTTNDVSDIVLENVQVKRAVPNESPTRIVLQLRSAGYSNRTVQVQIRRRGQVLAAQDVALNGSQQQVEINFTPHERGFHVYEVNIPAQPGEWLASNNRRAFGLEVVEPTIRVIYMEGTPAEWRFLKNAAESDPNIKVKPLSMSFNPGDLTYNARSSGQTDENVAYPVNHPTKGFPRTMTELLEYDVVINSDIKKQFFTDEQLSNTVRFVEEFGGGFGMIGGFSSYGSGGYQKTIIDRIIPVAMEELTDYEQQPFQLTVPPAALNHPLMALGSSQEETERIWTQRFPKLYGYNRVDRAKPGAVVLAQHPTATTRYGPMVILAAQELGKGRTFAFTSDTTVGWGMDFERFWGEPRNPSAPVFAGTLAGNNDSRYYRQFWINTIRWLAAGRLHPTNSPVSLELARTYCAPNESVATTVRLQGAESRPIAGAQVFLNLADESGNVKSFKTDYDPSSRSYIANVQPATTGNFILKALATLDGQSLGEDRQVMVCETNDIEMAEVRANPDLMARIASLSGGKTLNADHDGGTALASALQLRTPVSVVYHRTPLWDKASFLALALGLLTTEWVARRLRGLA